MNRKEGVLAGMGAFAWAIVISISVYPLNYLTDASINMLPFQVICYVLVLMYYLKWKVKAGSVITLALYMLYMTIVLLTNLTDAQGIASSGLVVTVTTLIYLAQLSGIKNNKLHRLKKALQMFFLIFMFYSLCLNISHIMFVGLSERTKGFGSGTLYALLSLYSVIYSYDRFKMKEINFKKLVFLILVPMLSMYLAQSRGVLLTLVVIFIVTDLAKFKIKTLIKVLYLLGVVFVVAYNFSGVVTETAYFQRFELGNYNNINQFASGRVRTQEAIMSWFLTERNYTRLVVGNGINSLKKFVELQGLQFPHLDMLYVLYDGGLLSLFFYLIFMGMLFNRFYLKRYFIIYFLSSLHTNMILAPAYVALAMILSESLRRGSGESA